MSELSAKYDYPWKTLLWAGLLVGTLDISAATTHFMIKGGADPTNILIYIASGVLGQKAFDIGAPVAGLGLLFHYLIAYSWAAFFFFIYPRFGFISWNWILIGMLYGIFVWLIMNKVVVPISSTPKSPFKWENAIINCIILIFMIGLPLSYIARRRYSVST